ncbi:winged helix DNA-binding domain-containing protein [Streptomyces sp. NRRL WC-3742]|uniref:winged helix DNA-binding domain-containing protein n=1 Tax=Streptomyces sp. NRRL WC-3742 TaxID=1463934 RepID=UPI0004CBB7A3|nr:winged helix DNA-binding domain-containing protein [Streptomyces sp. NRRL WC-3742]
MSTVLDRRALNRATLHRQGLLEPWKCPPLEALRHLIGLQSQVPDPPYFSLWTRLAEFTHPELTQLIQDRLVVRTGMMRATLHLVTAEDFLTLRPLFQPVRERAQRSHFGKKTAHLDQAELLAEGRKLLAAQPMNNKELKAALHERWPDTDAAALMYTVHYLLPLVQVPPGGLWRSYGSVPCTTDEAWLGRNIATESDPGPMILRYLAAYGPASVKDVQAWSGLTRLAEVVDRLRPQLRRFTDEQGVELFDLPDGPLPDAGTETPVRFLPEFDNLMVAFADRRRVISDEYRQITHTKNGLVAATVLVDGTVRGRWRIDRVKDTATLTVEPFETLTAGALEAVEAEGLRLLGFAAEESQTLEVVFG